MTDQLVVGGQLGNYLIESVIGRGGMSVVFKAKHGRLGMPVALKVLAPELSTDDTFRERFLREAQIAAGIGHPNVIPIHDMGLHENSLYIVMRYVAGGDLKTLITEAGPLELDRVISLLTPIAAALDTAHTHGLVHRDVKPANILIQRSTTGAIDHVYLTDFGIAKSASFSGALTGTGASIGTVGYMAPEQLEGSEVTAQTDVYALAVTFYECLTGRVPFQRELAEGIHPPRGQLEPVTRSRPDIPPAIDEVLARALSRNASERFETCEQLANACRDAAAMAPPAAAAAVSATAISAPEPPVSAADAPVSAVEVPADPPPAESVVTPPISDPADALIAANAEQPATPPEEPSVAQRDPEPDPEPEVAAPVAAAAPPPPASGSPAQSGGSRMKPLPLVAALVVVAAIAVVAVVVLGKGSKSTPEGKLSEAPLAEVPTNHVTGSGEAAIRLHGDVATFTVTTNGLDNNEELSHLIHLHAGGKGECPPASAARLHNGHLTISTTDGILYYGPPAQALTTHGDTSVASILVFSRFPSGGSFKYERTITLAPKLANEIRAGNAVIVVHGTDYDNSGIYSGVLDRSDLNKSLPGTATAPALCGKVVGAQSAASPRRPGAQTLYEASLHPTTVTGTVTIKGLFLCHPGETGGPVGDRRRAVASVSSSQATA